MAEQGSAKEEEPTLGLSRGAEESAQHTVGHQYMMAWKTHVPQCPSGYFPTWNPPLVTEIKINPAGSGDTGL